MAHYLLGDGPAPGHNTPMWLKHIALFTLLTVGRVSALSAQTPGQAPGLDTILSPGMTVWITDAVGREEKTRVVDVSSDVVTTSVGEDIRRFAAANITRVRVRQSDSVLNGALWGAGAALASGLLLCSLTETWENCRDDVGPMFRSGAIGAGAGIGIDALIRGRRTVYPTAPGSARLHATPILDRHVRGLQVSFTF
jgi:hypothetical protein